MRAPVRTLHVTLTDPSYKELRAAADQAKRPAIELARQAIEEWLARARRAALHREIRVYAERHAGGEADLIPEFSKK